MIKIIILLTGIAVICYGRPPVEGSLHVVYSKMLSEVGMLHAEPRSGVAYVYPITASESPLPIESSSLRSSGILLSQNSDIKGPSKEIVAVPKALTFKDGLPPSKLIKEKKITFLYIDPLDPKVNESGVS